MRERRRVCPQIENAGGVAEVGQADGDCSQQACGAFGIVDGLVH